MPAEGDRSLAGTMAGEDAASTVGGGGRASAWKMLCPRGVLSAPGFNDLETRDLVITAAASLFPGTSLHALTVKGPAEKVESAFAAVAQRILKVCTAERFLSCQVNKL